MDLSERTYPLELYMTPEGFTLSNLVSQLEHATTKPANIGEEGQADEASIQILAKRVAAVYNELSFEFPSTVKVPSKLKRPLLDYARSHYQLLTFLKQYRQEHATIKISGNRKLVEHLQTAHHGVDRFVKQVEKHGFTSLSDALEKNPGVNIRSWQDGIRIRRFVDCATFDNIVAEHREYLDKHPEVEANAVRTYLFERARELRQLPANPPSTIAVEDVSTAALVGGAKLEPWFIPSGEIISELDPCSSGGYADVYQAHWGQALVIIKRLKEEHFENESLKCEIKLWYGLDHPHILKLYGVSYFAASYNMVSEFARHGRLNEYLAIRDNKPQLWRLLYEASLGILFLHQRNIVHADLKCENILVGEDRKAKIADFGLSFFEKEHDKVPCTMASHWLAPECMTQCQRSCATDVYMFGMCIVEATTGQVPWGKTLGAVVKYRITKLKELPASVDFEEMREARQLVRKMCVYDPANRIGMAEVAASLKSFADAHCTIFG